MEKFSRLEKLTAFLYFIWFSLNLVIFFSADEGPDNKLFWPFNSADQSVFSTYDIAEFSVYVGIPLILFGSLKIMLGNKRPIALSHDHYHHSNYFLAFLEEKIKAEELQQQLNALRHQPVSNQYLEELKADREKIILQGTEGWRNKIQVKEKYKQFER